MLSSFSVIDPNGRKLNDRDFFKSHNFLLCRTLAVVCDLLTIFFWDFLCSPA